MKKNTILILTFQLFLTFKISGQAKNSIVPVDTINQTKSMNIPKDTIRVKNSDKVFILEKEKNTSKTKDITLLIIPIVTLILNIIGLYFVNRNVNKNLKSTLNIFLLNKSIERNNQIINSLSEIILEINEDNPEKLKCLLNQKSVSEKHILNESKILLTIDSKNPHSKQCIDKLIEYKNTDILSYKKKWQEDLLTTFNLYLHYEEQTP